MESEGKSNSIALLDPCPTEGPIKSLLSVSLYGEGPIESLLSVCPSVSSAFFWGMAH